MFDDPEEPEDPIHANCSECGTRIMINDLVCYDCFLTEMEDEDADGDTEGEEGGTETDTAA